MPKTPLFENQLEEIQFTKSLEEITNQLTQHKLDFVREFLRARNVRGVANLNRSELRVRLESVVREGFVTEVDLQSLLDELDLWGNQRILLRLFPHNLIANYQNPEFLQAKLTEIGLDNLMNGQISLKPTMELTPMRVSLDRIGDIPTLKLAAAKTREISLPQKDIEDKIDENYPGIVFKPYKQEVQKAVAFAEINLQSGLALISARTFRQGQAYTAEFGEFYALFNHLLPFEEMLPVELYQATRAIYGLDVDEIRLLSQNRKTQTGNTIGYRSHSKHLDFRTDNEMTLNWGSLPNAQNHFCNCVWQTGDDLGEEVHSHIYAPEGQITILGEVREQSARYVLRRILELN